MAGSGLINSAANQADPDAFTSASVGLLNNPLVRTDGTSVRRLPSVVTWWDSKRESKELGVKLGGAAKALPTAATWGGWEPDNVQIESTRREEAFRALRFRLDPGEVAVNMALFAACTDFVGCLTTVVARISVKECVGCMSEYLSREELQCGHAMCRGCLKRLCLAAVKDLSLLPVSCCRQPISMELLQTVLTVKELITMQGRLSEKTATRKMYCSDPACSHFIDLSLLDDWIRDGFIECPACARELCVTCNAGWTFGHLCEDTQADMLDELSAEKGWRKCSQCQTIVSKLEGCNHITCLCENQFCYQCGAQWEPRTCSCDLFDEESLGREGERRRQAREQRLERPLLERERTDILDNLQNQNNQRVECAHVSCPGTERFEYLHTRKLRVVDRQECANCDFWMKFYCYECDECDMRFCLTCRFHRRLR
eukprot:384881-Rhodomonas_salina.5